MTRVDVQPGTWVPIRGRKDARCGWVAPGFDNRLPIKVFYAPMNNRPSTLEEICKWASAIGTLILVLWLIVEFVPPSLLRTHGM